MDTTKEFATTTTTKKHKQKKNLKKKNESHGISVITEINQSITKIAQKQRLNTDQKHNKAQKCLAR